MATLERIIDSSGIAPPPALDAQPAPFDLDPTKLEGMTKEELIGLIKRCAGYSWGVGLMTREEIGEAMMHRLAAKALDPNCREWLTAIQQWLDRERGKPVTPIAAQIRVEEVKPIDTKELARRIKFALALAGEELPGNGALLVQEKVEKDGEVG